MSKVRRGRPYWESLRMSMCSLLGKANSSPSFPAPPSQDTTVNRFKDICEEFPPPLNMAGL